MMGGLASVSVGALALLLGFVVLVRRVNILQLGVYRLDYIALHVSLGSGCMVSGWLLLAGSVPLQIAHVALALGTAALLSAQRQVGIQWQPPERQRTDYAQLPDAQLADAEKPP